MCLNPDDEVAVAVEADPSVSAAGVGTLDLVLPADAFVTQVAAEVTLEARPERNGTVPGIVAKESFWNVQRLQQESRKVRTATGNPGRLGLQQEIQEG